ncbi:uncharacterized protein LOC141616435 [Silene latifolia]|uniref:uncharacterized protein LOC141616435 n=1 Tax=Silene latifolia TaxID=37657 RepID=UPI003D773989
MATPGNKDIDGIENLDRISQLPEHMILNILSRIPLEDSARAAILSKTWKNFCSLYPILYFDQNLFALQSLVSANKGGGEPDINQIRGMFMDSVDYQLSRVRQRDSPIRKLALSVAINDSMYFSRVDQWMELVRQINVEDLCVTVQTVDFMWDDGIYKSSVVYEFPLSVLASKGLRSACIQGCKLGCETLVGDPINEFFSLQRLCLSHVFMDEHVVENLIKCCQGIETLVLDNCSVDLIFLELSKFPKLKKAVVRVVVGKLDYVDVVDTNLEYLKCDADTELHISPSACAGIRELALDWCIINQPYLFKDLTVTFPVLEEADFYIHDTDTLKATNNVLRKLTFYSYGSVRVKEVHIDCPSLTLLDFSTQGLTEFYVDCPKLRVFTYRGTTVPDHVFCSSMADLEESRCTITMYEAYDTLWLVKLRAFLILVIGNVTNVKLTFTLPMAKFEPEKVEAIEVSSRYNVHLSLVFPSNMLQSIAALMDGLLWIIRPTTFTVSCETYNVVKYLCENLFKKQEDNICDEQLTPSLPCWMHQLEDFHVECPLDVPVTKKNLAVVPEQCRTLTTKQVRFIFHWCYNR